MSVLLVLAALIVADLVMSVAVSRPRPARWVSVAAVACGVASLVLSVSLLAGWIA